MYNINAKQDGGWKASVTGAMCKKMQATRWNTDGTFLSLSFFFSRTKRGADIE
jgi:hypothetical protein